MQALEFLLSLTVVTGILYRVAKRVGIVGFETDINADPFAGGGVLYQPSGLYRELTIVAISTADNPDAFDLLGREGFDVLLFVAHQTQAANPTAIYETNMFAGGFQFPARLFILHGTVIMLERGIALLAGLMLRAVVIEAGNRAPGTICRGLPGLRVETGGKGILVSEHGTVALEVIFGDTASVHPLAQALVPDELGDPNGFLDSSILLWAAVEFVLLNEHPLAFSL